MDPKQPTYSQRPTEQREPTIVDPQEHTEPSQPSALQRPYATQDPVDQTRARMSPLYPKVAQLEGDHRKLEGDTTRLAARVAVLEWYAFTVFTGAFIGAACAVGLVGAMALVSLFAVRLLG